MVMNPIATVALIVLTVLMLLVLAFMVFLLWATSNEIRNGKAIAFLHRMQDRLERH